MIFIAADHAGYKLKEKITAYFKANNIEFKDFGTFSEESVDYPDYAGLVCKSVQADGKSVGILICGTGIGMSIAANKYKNIRAALCTNEYMAKVTREHNDANVLCLGSRVTDDETALKMVSLFLNTEFSHGRHEKRVEKLNNIK